jgi:protease-4
MALLGFCLMVVVLAAAGIWLVGQLHEGWTGGAPWRPADAGRMGGVDEQPRMREIWSAGDGDSEVKVARILLRGAILINDAPWNGEGAGSASSALRAIRCAGADPAVRAILLDIDSPGGGITLSDQIYHELKGFRESDDGRVVVVLMGDLCASGGYYVALAADRIVAHPTTLTGSIGVLLSSLNLRELADKIGVRDVTIKSGANKDMLNPLRDLSPAQTNMLQQVVDALHGRFVGLVADNRNLSVEEVRRWADGRVFLADDALRAGLIDAIGYRETAMQLVAERLEVDEPLKVIRYEDEASWMDLFRRPRLLGARGLQHLLEGESRLRYQWRP